MINFPLIDIDCVYSNDHKLTSRGRQEPFRGETYVLEAGMGIRFRYTAYGNSYAIKT